MTKTSIRQFCGLRVLSLAAVAVVVAACGNGNGSGSPTATPTTATPTSTRSPTPQESTTASPTPTNGMVSSPTPTSTTQAGTVSGLLVLNGSVIATAGDALQPVPPGAVGQADATSFDRALSHADWSVAGTSDQRGVTSADGRFEITGLSNGRYSLQVTKTLSGNLASFTVPFAVGDDGTANVVAEVSQGQVRSTSTYTQGGVPVRDVVAPNGTHVIVRDGRLGEIGDPIRTLVDPDGTGTFVPETCSTQLWECGPDAGCGNDRVCACTASCPLCEDCGPPVCVPPGPFVPYTCNSDGSCANPGDRCTCVASCPECDDCTRSVCVPGCDPVNIEAIAISSGPSSLVVGQQGSLRAVAKLSDGNQMDVTYLVTWTSSDETVAAVDSWGTVSALAAGTTAITATLGELTSAPWSLQVTERPALQKIYLQNISCYYPLGLPQPGDQPVLSPPATSDILPVPGCLQVVQIGGTLQFRALGEFADGYYQDITNEVTWQVDPAEVGDAVAGTFTGKAAGTAQLTAALDGVTSDPTDIHVVTEPTVVGLSIYADNGGYPVILGRPVDATGAPIPCFDCGYTLTVLKGDELAFHATAQYDTGEWRDVTAEVAWHSSDSTTAPIDAQGVMTATQAGDAVITATFAEVTSNEVDVHVVDEATLQSLSIYQEGSDRVVGKGDQVFFQATGFYDVGISRDVTKEAVWHSSDEALGGFDTPGVFTGRSAGTVEIWVTLDGQESNHLSLEVFETSELSYCDPAHVNRSVWNDDFNRVILESDCDHYSQPGTAALRYTVTEIQPHGGIFDPCLDLYVYQGGTHIRTLREEGCGDPFLPSAAPGYDQEALKYQLRAFWDLKDDKGNPVPAGKYTIYGRFYLYYDPVVSIDVQVGSSGSEVPTPTPSPTPAVEGLCFRGIPGSDGSSFPTSQSACCYFSQVQASPLPVFWCPTDQIDPNTKLCLSYVDPCDGSAPPTITPTMTVGPTTPPSTACPADDVQPQVHVSVDPPSPKVGDTVKVTVSVSNASGGLPSFRLSGTAPYLNGPTQQEIHGFLAPAIFELQAVQAGTATLQASVNFETQVGCDYPPIYQFVTVASEPIAVTIAE